MGTVSDILDAIRTLPRPDRLRLLEQLEADLHNQGEPAKHRSAPPDPRLELRNGFYVFTGPVDIDAVDHRRLREDRADHIARLAGAGRG
jgi:hypothetical protein